MTARWHYCRDGQSEGTVSTVQLRELVASGRLRPTDFLWKDGLLGWVPAGRFPSLFLPHPADPGSADLPTSSGQAGALHQSPVWEQQPVPPATAPSAQQNPIPSSIQNACFLLFAAGTLAVTVFLIFATGVLLTLSMGATPWELIVGVFAVASLAALPFLAAWQLGNGKRDLAAVVAVLSLPVIPIGPILGMGILVNIYNSEANEWVRSQKHRNHERRAQHSTGDKS